MHRLILPYYGTTRNIFLLEIKKTWLAPTHEDTVFVRISPSCRHCLRTYYSFCQPQRRRPPSCAFTTESIIWKLCFLV